MIIITNSQDEVLALPFSVRTQAEAIFTADGLIIKNRFTNQLPDPGAVADGVEALLQCLRASS